MKHLGYTFLKLSLCLSVLMMGSCESDDESSNTEDVDTESSDTDAGSDSDDIENDEDDTSDTDSEEESEAQDNIDDIVTSANAFLAGLTDAQRETVAYDITDSLNRTCWSNFPESFLNTGGRPGISFGNLDDTSRANVLTLASNLLSDEGYTDFIGVLRADDYLGEIGNDTDYTSDNAHVAIFGTPASTGNWMVFLGNHHLAVLISFVDGVAYPAPYHLAAEPRTAFVFNDTTYQPMVGDGETVFNLFNSLDEDERSTAQLQGTINGLVLGPVEYCTGSYSNVSYPTQQGLKVSDLSDDKRALVTAAINEWVGDFAGSMASSLMSAYTSDEAYQQTYISWSTATAAATQGSYIRIDGPRVWIELSVEGGIVIRDQTHYHTIFRDKAFDYGGTL